MAANVTLFQAFKKNFKAAPPANPPLQPNPDQSALSIEVTGSNKEKLLDPTAQLFGLAPIQTQNKYDYEPDRYPPDIKMAKEHAQARRVSIPSYLYDQLLRAENKNINNQSEPVDLCDCCGCPVKNQQLPLSCSRYELFFLGAGFPLFFDFIVWGLGMLMFMFLISSIFGLASNAEVMEMGDQEDDVTWWVKYSLGNNQDKEISNWKGAQMIVNFFTVVILLVYLQFFRRQQRKTAFECDFKNLTPSDFTIKVSGLPLNFLDYELKEHFKKIGEGVLPVNVVKINKTYAIGSYIELLAKKNKALTEKRNLEEQINKNNEDLNNGQLRPAGRAKILRETPDLQKRVNEKGVELAKLEIDVREERDTLMKSYVKFTGTAYVTFETPEQAAFIKKKLKKTFEQKMKAFFLRKGYKFGEEHFYHKNLIEVERAPEPNDIIWENLGTSWLEKFKLQWWTAFYTFLVLLVCFFCIFGLTYIQRFLTDPDDPKVTGTFTPGLINALGAIFISVVNYLLNFVIKRFASMEKHLTMTGYDSSIASKKVVAQFLNTAVIYIIISWLFGSWTDNTGLINQLRNICISTIVINSALFAFDPLYVLRLWQRRNVIKNTAKSMMTQSEAHALFEDPSLDIPNLYSGVINVMLFSAFYATLEPFVVLFGIATLSFYYWIFKVLLLRRSSIPVELGKKIAYDMIEVAEYVPLAMALGDVLFNVKFYHYANPWSITACCLCFINFIVPMSWVNKQIFNLDEKHRLITESADYRRNFFTARTNFTFEYDRLNPITQKKAVEEWVTFVERKDSASSPTLDASKKKDFAKNLFSTLQKANTQDIKEEEKEAKTEENGQTEENKENGETKENEEKVIERKPTEDDGLENYFMFSKQKAKAETGDKKTNAIAAMYGKQKPKGLFLGALGKK